VSRRRVKRLERLIDSFIASDATRHRPARAMRKTAATRGRWNARQGVPQRSLRSALRAPGPVWFRIPL